MKSSSVEIWRNSARRRSTSAICSFAVEIFRKGSATPVALINSAYTIAVRGRSSQSDLSAITLAISRPIASNQGWACLFRSPTKTSSRSAKSASQAASPLSTISCSDPINSSRCRSFAASAFASAAASRASAASARASASFARRRSLSASTSAVPPLRTLPTAPTHSAALPSSELAPKSISIRPTNLFWEAPTIPGWPS